MPRLFVSIPLPNDVKQALASCQQPRRSGIRWVDPQQMHVTLCFLDDVPAEKIPAITARLEMFAKKQPAFAMRINRLRFKQPAMIWAEFDRSEPFDRLYQSTHEEMAKLDPDFVWVAEQMRRAHAHVTVARLGRDAGRVDLPSLPAPLDLPVHTIDLMESMLQPSGPVYKTLASFSLLTA